MEQNLNDRFWSKVDVAGDNECWNWKAGTDGRYGLFRYGDRKIKSNRMTWFLVFGEFPKLCVCHTCDNVICCNPKHLFLGTHQENMDDKVRKGRQSRLFGEKNPLAKLNRTDIPKIRKMIEEGVQGKKIAEIFHIDPCTVTDIKNNKTWQWVK